MSDVPLKFIPHGEQVVGDEPDPPTAGWMEGGASPTDADVCPYCDELVECVNQHAGYVKDGSRWHRRCHLLSMGFADTDEERERSYRWSGTIDAPDTRADITIWAGTFVLGNWRTCWEFDSPPTARDKAHFEELAERTGSPTERAAATIINHYEWGGADE